MEAMLTHWQEEYPAWRQAAFLAMKLASGGWPVIHAYSRPVLCAEAASAVGPQASPARQQTAAPCPEQGPDQRSPARPEKVEIPEQHSGH